jgi:hypothetical protein
MSLQPVTVTIWRNQPTDDNAGGVIENWVVIKANLKARRHFKQTQGLARWEDQGSSGGGPGTVTQSQFYMAFERPFPDVQVNDRIEQAGGDTYNVLFVRGGYELNMQVDVEVVK